MWSLYEMPSSFRKHLISVACNFFRMSTVNVQVSQAYNSTEITKRFKVHYSICSVLLQSVSNRCFEKEAPMIMISTSPSTLTKWSRVLDTRLVPSTLQPRILLHMGRKKKKLQPLWAQAQSSWGMLLPLLQEQIRTENAKRLWVYPEKLSKHFAHSKY